MISGYRKVIPHVPDIQNQSLINDAHECHALDTSLTRASYSSTDDIDVVFEAP